MPDQHFCHTCGQKVNTHRLSFHEILHDVVHYFTHADKGIFQLFAALAVKPGVVAREYIAGKRQKYFKPLNFFLIVAGLLAFVSSSFYTPNNERTVAMTRYAQTIKDPAKKQVMLDMAERTKKVAEIIGKYSNIINMTATPLIALCFWLLYLRRKYNFVEHLAANMYFIGFIMIFYSVIIVPLRNLVPAYEMVWIGIFFLVEMLYRAYAYYTFINARTTGAALKAIGISLLISVLWFTATAAFVTTYIRTGFH